MGLFITTNGFELLVDKRELRRGLRKTGNQVKQKAKELILAPKSGKDGRWGSDWESPTEARTRGAKRHTASAPGEAPASLTGLLANSMQVTMKRDVVRVVDRTWYALIMEAGAKGGGPGKGGVSGASQRSTRYIGGVRTTVRAPTTDRVMEPRPFLTTALALTDVSGALQGALATIITSRTKKKK